MKHRILTCKNHLTLRWSCKEIAWSDKTGYNSMRNLFFKGISTGKMYSDKSGVECSIVVNNEIVKECQCNAKCLILAPEDAQVI